MPPETKALDEYCQERIDWHTEQRDEHAEKVTKGLTHIQPDPHYLAHFLDALNHAYEVEAWTHVLKQPHLDSALMTLNRWATSTSRSPHPVSCMADEAKTKIALDVVGALTKDGYLEPRHLRIFLIGIYGIDGD